MLRFDRICLTSLLFRQVICEIITENLNLNAHTFNFCPLQALGVEWIWLRIIDERLSEMKILCFKNVVNSVLIKNDVLFVWSQLCCEQLCKLVTLAPFLEQHGFRDQGPPHQRYFHRHWHWIFVITIHWKSNVFWARFKVTLMLNWNVRFLEACAAAEMWRQPCHKFTSCQGPPSCPDGRCQGAWPWLSSSSCALYCPRAGPGGGRRWTRSPCGTRPDLAGDIVLHPRPGVEGAFKPDLQARHLSSP